MPAPITPAPHRLIAVLVVVLTCALSACGYRGPLYLPEDGPPAQQPAAPQPAAEPPSAEDEDEDDGY